MLGQTLGSYSILERLGQGAMGEVFLGEHRHLKRRVAIKMLARELLSRPELLERFFLEARATSVIAHPGIVQIFDCEVDAEGRPYIVMEYLPGETLGRELARRQGPLPIQRAARLARGIAEALEAAHDKGIIHRDLKPDNVFVTPEPVAAVKVVDFGIAKLVGELRAASAHQTHSGAIMGTPLYMSPEQCRGSGSIDFRTDIYSLGCVLFEMLTGRPPFVEEGMGELLVDHLKVPPPAVKSLNAEVPDELAALVAQLLEKEPERRPANMREVAERLTAMIPPGGTYPPATSASVPPSKAHVTTFGSSAAEVKPADDDLVLPARSRTPLLVGAVVVLLLAGGGLYAAKTLGGPSVAPQPAPVAETKPQAKPEAQPETKRREPAEPPVAPSSAAATTDVSPKTSPAVAGAPSAPDKVSGPRPGKGKGEKGASTTATPASSKGRLIASAEEPKTAAADERDEEKSAAKGKDVAVEKAARDQGASQEKDRDPEKGKVPGAKDKAGEARAGANEEGAKPAHGSGHGVSGTWEGPWADPEAKQQGRLYLVVKENGHAAGWLNNAGANTSFRLVGKVGEQGQVDLTCQCPANQMFSVRGDLRVTGDALEGGLSLWAGGRAFGHPKVNVRRNGAP